MSTLPPRALVRARRSALLPHLALLLVIVIWSANATVLKVGLAHVRPVPFMTVRFAIGGTLLALVALATGRRLRQMPPVGVVAAGAVTGIIVNQLGFTYGVKLSTAVDASIIMGAGPICAVVGLFVVSRQRPPLRRMLGLGLGLAGLVLVVGASRGSGGSLLGDAVLLTAPISWGVYLLVAAEANRTTNALVYLAWTALFAMVVLVPLAAIEGAIAGGNDWVPAIPSLLYSGLLATGAGYGLYFWALPRLGITETAVYTYLQPLLGALIGAFFLHEVFGALQMAGALAIIAAAYFGSWSRVKVPQQSP